MLETWNLKIFTLFLECCNHSNRPAFTCGTHSPQVSSLHSLLTGRGCSCSSWECRRESCPWNRRYRRSPGCSAPAATTAGLPQSLASLSSHWCLWKNQTTQKDISLFPSLPLLLCILVVHASLLNRLWTLVPETGEQHPQNHCSGPAACCAGSLLRKPNPFTICPSLAHAHPSSCFKRIEKRMLQ